MDIINLIVIGAGLIGPRHASHIYQRSDCRIFAIVDHSLNGPNIASKFSTNLFKNLDEMYHYIEENNLNYPDGAIIATPNHTHVDFAVKLAEKGINLLIEKPLSSNALECKYLINYLKDLTDQGRGVKTLIGHHRRFNPYIVYTKQQLTKIGTPIAIQGSWCLKKPDHYYLEKPWRTDVTKGGGTLLINLVHDLDLLLYLIGPIERIYAELLPKQREYDVDEGAVLTISFKNGCKGTFICGDNLVSPFNFENGTGENPNVPFFNTEGFYRIFGSQGTLSVPDMKFYYQSQPGWENPIDVDHTILKNEETNNLGTYTPATSFTNMSSFNTNMDMMMNDEFENQDNFFDIKPFDLQLSHFIDLIRGQDKVNCTAEDALMALLCIETVMKSVETGKPEYVPEIQDLK